MDTHEKSFSESLKDMASALNPDGMTLRELLFALRERGHLMLCMILTIPFLLPVSIPGTSAPFGMIIAFVSISLMLNIPPWLPEMLMKRRVSYVHLLPMLEKGSAFFHTLEKWVHPRLTYLARGNAFRRLNGIMMLLNALILMLPVPLPLTNTIPAYGVLFLSMGCLEHDGKAILLGYLMLFLGIAYFSLIFFGVNELWIRASH